MQRMNEKNWNWPEDKNEAISHENDLINDTYILKRFNKIKTKTVIRVLTENVTTLRRLILAAKKGSLYTLLLELNSELAACAQVRPTGSWTLPRFIPNVPISNLTNKYFSWPHLTGNRN